MNYNDVIRLLASKALSKNGRDSFSPFTKSSSASAQIAEPDQSPTDGKNIPIVMGAVRLTGDVIWMRSWRTSTNECRADVAVCFGSNAFQRPISLMSLSQSGNYIYRRTGGAVVDPPSAVRFYDGTQTTADPKIAEYEGADKTPAFKGYIYAVLENVKIGDFSAEFTDNGSLVTEPADSVTVECDPDLAGIELYYHSYTGLYYGIEFPNTAVANIIVSDGCQIISRNPFRFDTNDWWISQVGRNGYIGYWPEKFYTDSVVYPIRCTSYVAVNHTYLFNWYADSTRLITTVDIVDPATGQILWGTHNFEHSDILSYAEVNEIIANGFFYGSQYEWKDTFQIPGYSAETFGLIKLYDRDKVVSALGEFSISWPYAWAGTDTQIGSGSLGAENNIAAALFDFSYDYRFFPAWPAGRNVKGNPAYYGSDLDRPLWDTCYSFDWIESDEYTAIMSYLATLRWDVQQWGLSSGPRVEDLIWLRNTESYAELGAVRATNTGFEAFRLSYSAAGVQIVAYASIDLPVGFEYGEIGYDQRSNLFLISATSSNALLNSRIYKLSVLSFVSYVETDSNDLRLVKRSNNITGSAGTVAVQNDDGSVVKLIDVDTGDIFSLYDGAAPVADPVVDLSRGRFYVPTVEGYIRYNAAQVVNGGITLVELITSCCALKGYDSSDLVFENLDAEVVGGIQIASTVRLSDLFNRLGTLYGFTFVETDRKLKFLRKRVGGVIQVDSSVSETDLVPFGEQDDSGELVISRASSNNLLGGMDLEFVNSDKNYENDILKIRRPGATFDVGSSTRIETLSVPLTLSTATAYSKLYESFYDLLTRSARARFRVSSWDATIEPGDCISVTARGVTTTGVVTRATISDDFVQDIELESILQSGQTSINVVEPPGSTVGTTTTTSIYGQYIHLDTPVLDALDWQGPQSLIHYGGLTAANTTSWSGADLYSNGGTVAYTKIAEYNQQPMPVAEAVSALSAPALLWALDDTSVLTVRVTSGDPAQFASQSYLAQMNGNIYAAYGRPGAWEIISWQTVTENSDGTISLSNLQRGLFGTHYLYMISTTMYSEYLLHEPGDLICILTSQDLTKIVKQSSLLWSTERYAVVTDSVALNFAVKTFATVTARSTELRPVANLRAFHVSGESTIQIDWDACSAIPGNWTDTQTITPMSEPVNYVIFVYGWSDTYVYESTSTSFEWTELPTEIAAYPDSNIEEIYVAIYQYGASRPYVGAPESIPSSYWAAGCFVREA